MFKNKHFIIGFSFVFILLLASVVNIFVFDNKIIQEQVIYNEKKEIVATAPFKPSLKHPLGTNTDGYDLLHIIIHGSKYTLGFSFLIVFMRVIISIGLGVLLTFYLKKLKHIIKPLSESFNYIAATLIVYFILASALVMKPGGFESSFLERTTFQIIIMTIIAIPTLSVLFNEEIERILKEPFMDSVQVLGGGKWHKFLKHVLPFLKPRLLIISGQQLISTLILLSHLGFLKVYFGGVYMDYSLMQTGPKTITYEWSGLIGDSFNLISVYPWIPLAPILFFALTCIAVQLMIIGMKDTLLNNLDRSKRKQVKIDIKRKINLGKESFQKV